MANPLTEIPLIADGVRDYDSDRSRAELVNLFPEQNNNGSFRSVRRCEGLTLFVKLDTSPVRSNFIILGSLLYVVSGSRFYSISKTKVATNLGEVGGTDARAVLRQNGRPDDNQILILNGEGGGFIYTTAAGLQPITDIDFLGAEKGDILNERFVLVEPETTRFFLSDISDGFSYNPASFASAEQSPDDLIEVVAKKSSAWMMGSRTVEQWQTFNDDVLPLRPIRGASIERGVLAKDSIAKLDDYIAWLADDGTVRMIQGSSMVKISDLDLELRIRGNGTLTKPGFDLITDAVGWWVDGPIHKIYYLTFPNAGYTWGFDLTTGQSHSRQSEDTTAWKAANSVLFDNKVLSGSLQSGEVFELDPANNTENGGIMRTTLTTPSLSWDQNVTIPLVELDMEVGLITDPSVDPKIMVYYTKDGNTFINWGRISLGKMGNYRKRVPMRDFGQIVRNKDFALRFVTTDAVEVRYYGLKADIRKSVL